MPSGSYNQVYVQCPFYKEDDGRSFIKCEGFGNARYSQQKFHTKAEYETQMYVFCCKHHKKCEYYRMLMKTKYDEEE